MSNKQPDALRLADQYETGSNEIDGESWCCPETAAELRRLHALNAQMLEALQVALKALDSISVEMTVGERYTNAGTDLLDSLTPVRAAIAAATGGES